MKYVIQILLSVTLTIKSFAQDEASTISNFTFWGGFEMYLPMYEGSRWGMFAEGYIKRIKFIEDPMGWFFRRGVSYYLKNGDRISGGMAYQYNFPYDEAMLPYNWPDWRIWQQYMIRKTSKRNPDHLWVHRFRPEERWLGRRYTTGGTAKGYDYYKFELTFRYMLRSQWYLNDRFGLAVYDELHLRLASSEPKERLVDQNRIYGGILYALDKNREWRIETGYMFHSIWNPADEDPFRRIRINHTWRVTLTADAPLIRRK